MQRIMRATAIVLLIVTLFYPLLAPPPHRIDEAHFQLITEGMTEAEVEAIFGVPAGSYDWARPQTDLIWLVAVAEMQQFEVPAGRDHRIVQQELGIRITVPRLDAPVHKTKQWVGRHGVFAVSLDERGCVVDKHSGPTRVEFPWQDWWRRLTER